MPKTAAAPTPKIISRQHGKAMKVSPRAKKPDEPVILARPAAVPDAPEKTHVPTSPDFIEQLDPRQIAPSAANPRQHFAEEALDELAASLGAHGMLQPITVRPLPPGTWEVGRDDHDHQNVSYYLYDTRRALTMLPPEIMRLYFCTRAEALAALPRYEIIFGERRWRASRLAELARIPAIVRDLDDLAAGEQRLVENGQREDISPLEEAAAYQDMLSRPGYDVDRLVAQTGKQKSTIYARLALLKLPAPAQKAIVAGTLGVSTAEIITRLETPEDQAEAAREILSESATFKQAKEIVAEISKERTVATWAAEAARAGSEAGLFMLTGDAAKGICRWGDTIERNCGYVAALDVCPRDPRGRLWDEVITPQFTTGPEALVTRYGVVVHPRVGQPKAVEIYEREQANAALKKLGLWGSEGSEASKARERRAAEKHEQGIKREEMMRDLDAIAALARHDRSPRNALLATVWAATCDRCHADAPEFVAKRRAWISLDDSTSDPAGVVRSMATNLTVAELQELVVELAIAQIGWEESYFEDGREDIRELLDAEFVGTTAETV